MAPPKQAPGPPFAKDEKVLCFHGDLMYEAKITDLRSSTDHSNTNAATIKADDAQYRVHYKGWKASWDDWVLQDRIRKFTDDNKALAAQLQQAARLRTAGGSKSAKKAIGKAVGGPGGDSEMSSARGSEERLANNTYGRGPRRGRDYELENRDLRPRLNWNKDEQGPRQGTKKDAEGVGKVKSMDDLSGTRGQRQSVRTAIERSKRDSNVHDSSLVAVHKDLDGRPQPNKRARTKPELQIQFPEMDPIMKKIKKDFLVEEAKIFKTVNRFDHLLIEPPKGKNKDHFYVNATGTRLLRHVSDHPYGSLEPSQAEHPKLVAAEKRSSDTPQMAKWFKNMDSEVNIPVAGVPTDIIYRPKKLSDSQLKKIEAQAMIYAQRFRGDVVINNDHGYNGQMVLNAETESIDKAQSHYDPMDIDFSEVDVPTALSGDLWRALAYTPTLSFGPIPSFILLGAKFTFEQEEAFHARPSIKIIIPDLLKGLLVDDWENITRNNQLVPIPHPHPVNQVLQDYINYEKPQRTEGSASTDILDETVAGLKEYFDKCLGRILLYRFERAQYAEIRERWADTSSELHGKTPCDTYGVEHLMRLLASLPELIAQTNMDQQSVNRLREELSKFCVWLEKNAGEYFVNDYEVPNAEYSEKAKN